MNRHLSRLGALLVLFMSLPRATGTPWQEDSRNPAALGTLTQIAEADGGKLPKVTPRAAPAYV